MTAFLNAIKGFRHAEERLQARLEARTTLLQKPYFGSLIEEVV